MKGALRVHLLIPIALEFGHLRNPSRNFMLRLIGMLQVTGMRNEGDDHAAEGGSAFLALNPQPPTTSN